MSFVKFGWVDKKLLAKAYNTWDSQAVTHPSTNQAQRCLTSVIGREPVYSTWYGRRHLVLWPAVVIRSAYSYYINCNTKWFLAVHKIFLSSNFVSSLQNVCRIMICHSVGLIDLVLNIKYTDECIIHFVPCQIHQRNQTRFPGRVSGSHLANCF